MLEIIVPDYKERYFIKPNRSTTVKKVKDSILHNLGIDGQNNTVIIDIENLNVLEDNLLIAEAVASKNSRLLLIAY